MPRKANLEPLRQLHQAIEKHPGQRASFFARLFGWRREAVARRLTSLEQQGVMLSEDKRGGLWLFSKH